jgi:hypothetical protein
MKGRAKCELIVLILIIVLGLLKFVVPASAGPA